MNRKAGLIWNDAQGERVLHVITTDTGVGSIESSLESHSNAVVCECWEGLDEVYTVSPTVATYPTVRITALLEFNDGMGSTARIYLPSPQADIFLSDGDTVDPSKIPDIIAACIGHLICGSGNVATAFTGGQLIRTKFSGITTVTP